MLREPLVTNECYHLLNRGVEKRSIFLDSADYRRFLFYLFACNTEKPLTSGIIEGHPRSEALVHILAYCLMPNHFHLLLRQAKDGGIEKFMRKTGTGYSMYFNRRYGRAGILFQNRFRSVHVCDNTHLSYLPHYIHANPLDLTDSNWRNGATSPTDIGKIGVYAWSSYPHYDRQHTDPVIDEPSIHELFGSRDVVKNTMVEWLSDMSEKNDSLNLE